MKAKTERWTYFPALVVPMLAFFILLGCGKDAARKSLESDSNGYICSRLHKFYTPSSVFAEKCPECGTTELAEVLAYVCEKKSKETPNADGCGHVTLGARGGSKHGGTICAQCKRGVGAFKLPYENELVAWGAKKATKQQVLLQLK